jgi:quercetin dioxygenase-like cupin family protein
MTKNATPEPAHGSATVLIDREIDWDDVERSKRRSGDKDALVAAARKVGARRKKLARGEQGFFMNRSAFPPNFRVPPHHHTHDELLVVLRGGCRFDGELADLGPDDSIVIPAGLRYGFECGPDGMEMLTIRTAEADFTIES